MDRTHRAGSGWNRAERGGPMRAGRARAGGGWLARRIRTAANAIHAHPRRTYGAAGAAALAIAALVWLAWPSPAAPYLPAARTRSYAAYTACLLADPSGVTGSADASVWSGMQQASDQDGEQVTSLTILGQPTRSNADVYLNTLATRHCDLVVAAGTLPAQATYDRAASFPRVRFVVVDEPWLPAAPRAASSSAPGGPANVTVLPTTSADQATSAVAAAVVTDFRTAASTAPKG